MFGVVLAVIGAFVLYLVVLPIVGIIGSFSLRVVAPYLIGSGLILALLYLAPLNLAAVWLVALAVIVWCVPALLIRFWPRTAVQKLGWHQGHYRACFALFTLGLCSRNGNGRVEETEYSLDAVLRTG